MTFAMGTIAHRLARAVSLLPLACLFAFGPVAPAGVIGGQSAPRGPGQPVHQHGRFEHSFTSSKDYDNPLSGVRVTVEFRGPGGERGEAPAFWDGGRVWKVRFSPERAGEWSFTTRSSDESNAGLHSQGGRFRVSGYRGPNDLYRRGAPRLAPNRRYLVQADGKPWFWLADTAWNGVLLATREEWDRYLADRARKKFTAVQVVMTQWRAGRADERGQAAFTGVESVRVHPEFFQRLDERIDQINEYGLVGGLVLLWALTSKDNESPGAALPPEQAALLAGYMVARYGAHHVLWILGGDGNYRGENVERWKAIGRAVFPEDLRSAELARGAGAAAAGDARRRPVTMHPGGMHEPWAPYKDEPWLDVLFYQSGHGNNAKKWEWNATRGGAVDWKMDPPRPVIDSEINYEGHVDYHTKGIVGEAQVRRAAYYSLLAAPPAGVTYGAHGVWYWSRKPEVPLDRPRSGIAEPWWECLDYPGARQMQVLREVFESVEWWRLRPDRSLLTEDVDDPEWVRYPMPARSESGDFALIYLPGNESFSLNLAAFGKPVTAAWIDPRTGARTPAGRLAAQPAVVVKTPGAGDWLLHLRR